MGCTRIINYWYWYILCMDNHVIFFSRFSDFCSICLIFFCWQAESTPVVPISSQWQKGESSSSQQWMSCKHMCQVIHVCSFSNSIARLVIIIKFVLYCPLFTGWLHWEHGEESLKHFFVRRIVRSPAIKMDEFGELMMTQQEYQYYMFHGHVAAGDVPGLQCFSELFSGRKRQQTEHWE